MNTWRVCGHFGCASIRHVLSPEPLDHDVLGRGKQLELSAAQPHQGSRSVTVDIYRTAGCAGETQGTNSANWIGG